MERSDLMESLYKKHLELTVEENNKKIEGVKKLVKEALQIDGGHHKQWYLEEIAKHLDIDLEDIEHDEGIIP